MFKLNKKTMKELNVDGRLDNKMTPAIQGAKRTRWEVQAQESLPKRTR